MCALRPAFSFVCAAETSVIRRSLFTVHCSLNKITVSVRRRLTAAPTRVDESASRGRTGSSAPTVIVRFVSVGHGDPAVPHFHSSVQQTPPLFTVHYSPFTIHCSLFTASYEGRTGTFASAAGGGYTSNKEWQRSSGDPTQPSKAGALGRGRATKCAHVRRKAPNGAKWSLRGREAAVSAAHKFRAPQQKSSAPTGAAPYLLSAMVKVNSVRPSRLVT